MAPPPLPLFSPSPKPPPRSPWLHGPKNPAAVTPPNPTETPPPEPHHNPKPQRNTSSSTNPLTAGVPGGRTRRAVLGIVRRVRSLELSDPPNPRRSLSTSLTIPFHLPPIDPPQEGQEEEAGEKEKDRPKSRAVPWSAAMDENLKVALRRERKVREPTRAERELEAAELERLRLAARGDERGGGGGAERVGEGPGASRCAGRRAAPAVHGPGKGDP